MLKNVAPCVWNKLIFFCILFVFFQVFIGNIVHSHGIQKMFVFKTQQNLTKIDFVLRHSFGSVGRAEPREARLYESLKSSENEQNISANISEFFTSRWFSLLSCLEEWEESSVFWLLMTCSSSRLGPSKQPCGWMVSIEWNTKRISLCVWSTDTQDITSHEHPPSHLTQKKILLAQMVCLVSVSLISVWSQQFFIPLCCTLEATGTHYHPSRRHVALQQEMGQI